MLLNQGNKQKISDFYTSSLWPVKYVKLHARNKSHRDQTLSYWILIEISKWRRSTHLQICLFAFLRNSVGLCAAIKTQRRSQPTFIVLLSYARSFKWLKVTGKTNMWMKWKENAFHLFCHIDRTISPSSPSSDMIAHNMHGVCISIKYIKMFMIQSIGLSFCSIDTCLS